MTKILRPNILIPVVLGLALLAALFALSDIKKVLAFANSFQKLYLLYFLVLIALYELVRGVQWHYLLTALEIHVPLRTQIFTFAAGEVTKSLPIGNYFQNYLLQQSQGTDFGLSSAATTLIVLTEVAVCVVGVTIMGLGSWTGWLRPLIIIGSAVFALSVWVFIKFHRAGQTPQWVKEQQYARIVVAELGQFRTGAARLLHPRILAIESVLSATYLFLAGCSLYCVLQGLGIFSVSLSQAIAVYFFSLAFSLIFPLPVDIGVLEISTVGALLAFGVNRDAAISAVLVSRVLNLGSSLTIALIAVAVLHDELRAALRGRAPDRQPQRPATSA